MANNGQLGPIGRGNTGSRGRGGGIVNESKLVPRDMISSPRIKIPIRRGIMTSQVNLHGRRRVGVTIRECRELIFKQVGLLGAPHYVGSKLKASDLLFDSLEIIVGFEMTYFKAV